MMKKCIKIFLIICSFFIITNTVNAESLKEIKDELAKNKAEQSSIIARQKDVQKKIASAKDDISDLEAEIEKCENEIEDLTKQIDELNAQIAEKQKEIDNLLSFLQITNGDNVYLEYVFEAKSFTDFIYRSAVVEELTKYNDEVIDEMYKLIEQHRKLQAELQETIQKNEKSIAALEEKLKQYDVNLNDLAKAHTDVKKDIEAEEQTIELYETIYKQVGCSEDEDLVKCLSKGSGAVNSSGFMRPIEKGSISSNYGYRICPVHGRELHNGIDIAVPMNTDVYAAAIGTVTGITRKSSCGGNIVTINHTIKGKQYRTVYMHLASINVSMGQVVTPLTVIGESGGGGYTLRKNGGWDTCSTGAHLHFTIKSGWSGSSTIDPRSFINFPSKGGSFYSRW